MPSGPGRPGGVRRRPQARARKRSPVVEPSVRGDGPTGRHRGGVPQRPLDASRCPVHATQETADGTSPSATAVQGGRVPGCSLPGAAAEAGVSPRRPPTSGSIGPEPAEVVVKEVELVRFVREHGRRIVERAVGKVDVSHGWNLLTSGGRFPPVATWSASRGPHPAQGRPQAERGHGARSPRRPGAGGIAVCDRGGVPQRPLNGEGVAAD